MKLKEFNEMMKDSFGDRVISIPSKTDNELIAEFMGGIISSVPNLINLPQTRGDANIHSVKGSEMLPNGTYSVHRLNELKYHTSWDWLMPVIEKIATHTLSYTIEMLAEYYYKDGDNQDGLDNIEMFHEAVVMWIKDNNLKTI